MAEAALLEERTAVGDRGIPPAVRQAVLHGSTGRTAHVGDRIPPLCARGTVRMADGGRDHGYERQRSDPSRGDGRNTSNDLFHICDLAERPDFQKRHQL